MSTKTVYQLVVTDLEGNPKDLLSIYEDAGHANEICAMINQDFIIARAEKIARVETRRFYYKD